MKASISGITFGIDSSRGLLCTLITARIQAYRLITPLAPNISNHSGATIRLANFPHKPDSSVAQHPTYQEGQVSIIHNIAENEKEGQGMPIFAAFAFNLPSRP